jgi:arylsulfatase A-like enzyme
MGQHDRRLHIDHGWHLGQHGLWGKVTLFQEAAKVPLIIAAPGVAKQGGASPRTVEMIDFFPTLTELAGLSTPPKLDGQSLVPLLKDPKSARDRPAVSVLRRGNTWGRAVYTEQWRYTEWGDAGAKGIELYDLTNDPREYRNLANDPAHSETRAKLKAQLASAGALHDADEVNKTGD